MIRVGAQRIFTHSGAKSCIRWSHPFFSTIGDGRGDGELQATPA